MKYKTKLGELDIEEKEVILFENGLPGFEHLRKFSVISLKDTLPIMWLVSLEDENVAFPIMDPWLVYKDYEFEISSEDVKELEIKDRERVAVWVILTIPHGNPKETTVNLLAPVVINLENGKGKQIILDVDKYSTKHKLASLEK
ncbi:flagellar assembly protein FliW [Thermosipho affectus]|uniref:Flagellar assembly factor FliW n=1 Tax=Thermosipho affectus TaxID=660294 RepID=A0ABX3IJ23_9BACT|nr:MULTISPECIES: flagellar assembly protein FliW [Thermosipho]ANQ53360.1 flagellar assembly protein FliW [Thermosipho sp. 1070]APT71810.1 flagellar assembly protein FliW [Thermosipho sp. 1063]ONN27824.1 flagellar assembly protein FliW [Thermosipho affectus]OOC45315.1 flagellar assembly protein FliW [Thermosipho sp. 1074]